MKYQTKYYKDLWVFINDIKSDIDNNYHISFYPKYRKKHLFRYKCFDSKIIYHLDPFCDPNHMPNHFEISFSAENLINWIKLHSKEIDSTNKLKAFL